jgi:hypothetical protein
MQPTWPLWRRLLFRLFFIYLALTMTPWTWLERIPRLDVISQPWYTAMNWLVNKSNALVFHVRPQLVPLNGSGDTSWGWANLWLVISLALIGMVIWSIVQHRKKEYTKLNYWLCLFTRYYVALVLFNYGVIKLFGLQMPFPDPSNFATPLGDLLPMRLSWLFIGYSAPYQFFSGLMEVMAGLLLLYRRTATLGVLIAAAAFMNVAILNLSYDIPVKIFSIQLVVCCLFLLANEMERILCFFVYNRPAGTCTIYHYDYPKKWMKVSRVVLKSAFIIVTLGFVIWESLDWQKQYSARTEGMLFKAGMYDVVHYAVNNDTIAPLLTDTLRWQNIVFDTKTRGSIGTRDTAFRRAYNRAYFSFKADTVKHSFKIYRSLMDSTSLIAALNYKFEDENTIAFWGHRKTDSLFFRLQRSPHNFQLAEKQFHWLNESTR